MGPRPRPSGTPRREPSTSPCKDCGVQIPWLLIGRPQERCLECRRKWEAGRQRAWRTANPEARQAIDKRAHERERAKEGYTERRHASRTRYVYSLPAGRYDEMLTEQGGRCAICRRLPEEVGRGIRRLAIDHDRSCCPGGKSCGECVRDLLCSSCNTSLGGFQDDLDLLVVAMSYISRHRANRLRRAS